MADSTVKMNANILFELAARYTALDFASTEADEAFRERIVTQFVLFLHQWIDSLSWLEKDKSGTMISKLSLMLSNTPTLVSSNAQRIVAYYTYHSEKGIEIELRPNVITLRDYLSVQKPFDEFKYSY